MSEQKTEFGKKALWFVVWILTAFFPSAETSIPTDMLLKDFPAQAMKAYGGQWKYSSTCHKIEMSEMLFSILLVLREMWHVQCGSNMTGTICV